jgi:hypothetical protein
VVAVLADVHAIRRQRLAALALAGAQPAVKHAFEVAAQQLERIGGGAAPVDACWKCHRNDSFRFD